MVIFTKVAVLFHNSQQSITSEHVLIVCRYHRSSLLSVGTGRYK